METLIQLNILLFTLIFLYVLIRKPYYVVPVLLFMFFYRFNFEVPGPLDGRGLISIILFARIILFDRENFKYITNNLAGNKYFIVSMAFLILSLLITAMYSPFWTDELKSFVLLIVSLLLGFILIYNENGRNIFIVGIFAAGVASTFDIMYSSIFTGNIRVVSLLKMFMMGDSSTTNHNYPGLLSGLSLVYAYLFYIRRQMSRLLALFFMILLSVGVILSTSRSTILAIVMVFVIFAVTQKEIKINIPKLISFTIAAVIFFILFSVSYNIISTNQGNTSLLQQMTYRLYQEPLKLIENDDPSLDKWGNYKEGNILWRLNRSKADLKNFFNLSPEKIFFGLGIGGYNTISTDYLNAHNGYVLLLIERGLIGFTLFFVLVIGLSISLFRITKRQYLHIPVVYLFLVIVFYAIGQNAELTGSLTFLLVGGMIGNLEETYSPTEDNDEALEIIYNHN